MGRAARSGLIGLVLLIVAVGAAGLFGAIRIPYLSPAASTGPEADRPDDRGVQVRHFRVPVKRPAAGRRVV